MDTNVSEKHTVSTFSLEDADSRFLWNADIRAEEGESMFTWNAGVCLQVHNVTTQNSTVNILNISTVAAMITMHIQFMYAFIYNMYFLYNILISGDSG